MVDQTTVRDTRISVCHHMFIQRPNIISLLIYIIK